MNRILFLCLLSLLASLGYAQPVIHLNQVAFNAQNPKSAVISSNKAIVTSFVITNTSTHKIVYTGKLSKPQTVTDWFKDKLFYQADFSAITQPGTYTLQLKSAGKTISSFPFKIEQNALAKLTVPAVVQYYFNQRANTAQELDADKHLLLYGSTQRVDLHGGWCDASGDVSKYFSHLAYANFVSPQQIPLVTWSLANSFEKLPAGIISLTVKDSLQKEALYGADYLMRSLSNDGYFYMIVFSYFDKNPEARRVVGLLANSVTTADYQCAFREGAGMAIAALARVSAWKQHGEYTSAQYLDAAKRAFNHLLANNTKYCDDGKENIIDDYCALMAATELWKATNNLLYQTEARKRAANINKRLSPQGYFIADDGTRPYWHAADAGLPVIALCSYLGLEKDAGLRKTALTTIKKALDYNLQVSAEVSNPFGYARQTFRHQNQIKNDFFIPHENETGWWWQGEDARLSSLATAAIMGGRLVYPDATNALGIKPALAQYAVNQLNWILGSNPYNICLLYGFGQNNVSYMASNYGHGSQRGGISNGITGKDGNADGSGIDFKTEAKGNEWRWTEQWLPHSAWFLQAVTAMSSKN